MRRTGPTNYQTQELLKQLENAKESAIWRRVAKDLRLPAKLRRTVNVYKIDKHARDGETVLVPGKVLSVGNLSKKVDVAALHFSQEARRKIEEKKGKAFTISELFAKNPKGAKVRILG